MQNLNLFIDDTNIQRAGIPELENRVTDYDVIKAS